MGKVVHFEIPADDPERLRAFYATTFGWEIETSHGPVEYYLVKGGDDDEPGINGAILKRPQGMATVVNTITVKDYGEAARQIVANGGAVLTPREMVAGVGWHSYCRDPEGNLFGILEPVYSPDW